MIFKCGTLIFSITLVLSICDQIVKETNSLDAGLAFFYVASAAIAGKIIHDRYQLVHILGSLTPIPSVTSFANRVASSSAISIVLGFLVYVCLFLLKVGDRWLTALSIFVCGFSTLYIWMQCILTTYVSTLYYDQEVALLRQCFANVSFVILVVMAAFGIATSFLPQGASGAYICFVATSICNYSLAAMFCVFILSFQKEYKFFAEGIRTDTLIDNTPSVNEFSNDESLFAHQEISNAIKATMRHVATS